MVGLGLLYGSCKDRKSISVLNIAAASNMQFAAQEIIAKFENQYNIKCELILSSSGKLTAQILEGAPYDVFLSADEKYPATIYENKMARVAPKVYAEGVIVLWTTRSDIELGLEGLLSDDIDHIAIANPKTAPYGRASEEILKVGSVLDEVESKLVYGESISQANRFVISGAAEVGFTSKAVVLGAQFADEVIWKEIPKSMHSPLKQAAIVISKNSEFSQEANLFYNFLFGKEAKKVLKDLGYSVSE